MKQALKQPNWKRWEEILLVDMYFRVAKDPDTLNEECEKLSKLLRRSNLDMALSSAVYRNVTGIQMKYQNIRHIVEGIGLSAHSRLDIEIVSLYQDDKDAFQNELKKILKCIEN